MLTNRFRSRYNMQKTDRVTLQSAPGTAKMNFRSKLSSRTLQVTLNLKISLEYERSQTMFCLPKQICTNRQTSQSDWNLFTPHLIDSGRRDCETLIEIFKFTYFRVVFITKKSSIFKVSVHIEMRLVSGPAGLYSKRVCLQVWSLNQSAIHGK